MSARWWVLAIFALIATVGLKVGPWMAAQEPCQMDPHAVLARGCGR